MSDTIGRGQPRPLGADPQSDGVSFSVYSADATAVELLLFGAVQATMIGRGIWGGERLKPMQLVGLALAGGAERPGRS